MASVHCSGSTGTGTSAAATQSEIVAQASTAAAAVLAPHAECATGRSVRHAAAAACTAESL